MNNTLNTPIKFPKEKAKTAIFTSCATNYIPKARVLVDSVKKFHDDIDVYLLAVDELPTDIDVSAELFDGIVQAKNLPIDDFERWIFGHTIVEACTAVKPFMLQYLLAQGYEQVFYFDPDIALFAPLTDLINKFDKNSILLTPHLCKPEQTEEAVRDNELSALKHGVFNFGFVGVKNDVEGVRYAQWWANRCYLACFDDIPNGVFTDQKWNDLVPALFDHVYIAKDPVYNVATWNYAGRKVEGSEENGFTVDGQPLVFHHFTGYDSGAHHAMLDKYGKTMPATTELSHWYEASCQKFEQADLAAVSWAYGQYDNGKPVTKHHRQLYRQRIDLRESFPSPFSTAKQGKYDISYFHWLEQEDLLDHYPYLPNESLPFSVFIHKTKREFTGYVVRTHRLARWQKKTILGIANFFFGLMAKPVQN